MSHTVANTMPVIYRSEAFVEDLDLLPDFDGDDESLPASRSGRWQRVAGWLLAVPGTLAVLASAVVIATLPA